MDIQIQNIDPKFRPFISEIEVGFECVTVWLKRGFVYSVTSASCSTWNFSDYRDEDDLIDNISGCLDNELIEITSDCWEKGQHFTQQDIINWNPASL